MCTGVVAPCALMMCHLCRPVVFNQRGAGGVPVKVCKGGGCGLKGTGDWHG